MTGRLNKSVVADGVIAYQDRENPRKFHYMPARIDAVLNSTLNNFKVQYYGIGEKPHWVKGNTEYLNLCGGIVSGQAVLDITTTQRESILKEIERVYRVDEPFLTPLILKDAEANPVFAKTPQEIGGGGSLDWPREIQFGSSFNFNIDSGNSLFPQLVARSIVGGDGQLVGSDIGINISGTVQLYGDPWTARITADLSQVWSYVRSQVRSHATIGWFNLDNASYERITQELYRNNIIKVEYIEGTGGKEYGRQLLESTRVVFQAINNQILAGEGIFKFKPNPDPQQPPESEGTWRSEETWAGESLPYQVSVNMSFQKQSFEQSIHFEQEISYTGVIDIPVHSSMNLGGLCGPQTSSMFHDITEGTQGCYTAEKDDAFVKRVNKELDAKAERQDYFWNLFLASRITFSQYQELMAMTNNQVFTEMTLDGTKILSREEAISIFHTKVRNTLGISL